jgi:hypothetical protein
VLQSIILLEEISRLNFRFQEMQTHLEKAEEFIIHLQSASGPQTNVNAEADVIAIKEHY